MSRIVVLAVCACTFLSATAYADTSGGVSPSDGPTLGPSRTMKGGSVTRGSEVAEYMLRYRGDRGVAHSSYVLHDEQGVRGLCGTLEQQQLQRDGDWKSVHVLGLCVDPEPGGTRLKLKQSLWLSFPKDRPYRLVATAEKLPTIRMRLP